MRAPAGPGALLARGGAGRAGPTGYADPAGWPRPPRLGAGWADARALRWFRLLRANQVHRFMAEFMAYGRELAEPPRRLPPPRRTRAALAAYGEALRQEWRRRAEAAPWGAALARADRRDYLGDPEVVRALVDGHVGLLVAYRSGTAPPSAVLQDREHLNRIFRGEDPDHAPIGGWNTRDGLGDACIRRCPLDPAHHEGEGLDAVLDDALRVLAQAVGRTVLAAGHGRIPPGAALRRLRDICGFTADMFLGLVDLRPPEETLVALVEDLPRSYAA